MEYSGMAIFFDTHEVSTLQRTALYTIYNFLAICGGLLGLFLGFSTFSTMKFTYRFALRVFDVLRKFKEHDETTQISRNAVISKDIIETIDNLNREMSLTVNKSHFQQINSVRCD